MCFFLNIDERVCTSILSTINLKQNGLSPFASFHCWKVPMKDYNDGPNKEEDKTNLLNFQTRSPGFVCDMQLWRNVVIVKLNSNGSRMPSLALAHSVLYKLALGKFINHVLIISYFYL